MQREKFEALIKGLEASGISRTEIARQCHISRMTVWRIAEGMVKDPAWSVGNRIKNLAVERAVTPTLQKML